MRILLSILVPPLGACRYGCAGCCTAPIGLFWMTAIVALVYGYLGGPLDLETVSWNTIGLGALLWLIAGTWAVVTVHSATDETCGKPSGLCAKIAPRVDEDDPLDRVRNAR